LPTIAELIVHDCTLWNRTMAKIESRKRSLFSPPQNPAWRGQTAIIGKRQFFVLLGLTALSLALPKKAIARPSYRIVDGWVLRSEDI
jgi:hypothetical protein